MSVSGLPYSIGQAPLDGLETIYADNIYTSSLDVGAYFNGMPISYFTGTTANIQQQINDITGQISGQTGNWGAFWCDVTINNPVSNTVRYAYVNNADSANLGTTMYGAAGGGLYQAVQVDEAGVYNFQFSCQVTHSSSSAHDVKVWFRKNGTDLPQSASIFTLLGNSESQVPAWNYMLELAAGDYVSVMWSCDTTQLSMPAIAAQSTPVVVPAIPSVILTIQQVTNLAAGPTGAAGDTPDFSIGTVQGVPYGNTPQVTISGTSAEPILNFVLEGGPQGPQGPQGPKGEKGDEGGLSPSQYTEIMAAASSAGGIAGGAAGTAAAETAIEPITTALGVVTEDVAALDGLVEGLIDDVAEINTNLTTLNDKTVNIVTASAGVSTEFNGAIICSEYGSAGPILMENNENISIHTTTSATLSGGITAQVESDAEVLIQAPVITINSGVAGGGSIYIGEGLTDAIFIQGVLFVPVNWNVTPFKQFNP